MVVTSNSKHPQRAPTSRHLGSVRRLSTTISIYFLPVTWRKHPVTSVQNAKRKLDKSTWFLTASPKKKEGFEMLGMPERFRIGAGMSLASLTSMICMITSVAWDGKPCQAAFPKENPSFCRCYIIFREEGNLFSKKHIIALYFQPVITWMLNPLSNVDSKGTFVPLAKMTYLSLGWTVFN